MLNISPTTAIYYSPTPVKMNRSFDGLCGIVAERMKLNPAMAGALFVFFNRRRTMVKTLCWEGDGFSIWSKRLEQGQFNVPSSADGRISLTYGENAYGLEFVILLVPVFSMKDVDDELCPPVRDTSNSTEVPGRGLSGDHGRRDAA